jgi:small subunit ribosomal protein S8
MLTRIRNASLAQKSTVSIPFTRINQQIAKILEKEGFIQTYQIQSSTIIPKVQNISSSQLPLLGNSESEATLEVLSSSSFPYAVSALMMEKTSKTTLKTVQDTIVSVFQTMQKAELLIRLKYRSKTLYKNKKKESCITNLKRISKPGLRIYANHKEIPRILAGTGILIVSTPEGLLTDREARLKGIGGELLCSIW